MSISILSKTTVNVNGLSTVASNGLELAIFPWEDAELVIAEAEAFLAESDAKPWLPFEDEQPPVDWDAIINDPMYDRYLEDLQMSGRLWSGGPVATCNWSWLDGNPTPEFGGTLEDEPGYLESTRPFAF